MKLCDLAREQGLALGFEVGDVALGVADLAGDAQELGCGTFAGDGGVDLAVIVEHALEEVGVAAAIGLVGARHQQGEMLLLVFVASEVGMNAPGDLAKECLEAGGRIGLLSLMRGGEGGVVGLLRLAAGFGGALTGRVGVVEIDLALGDAGLQVVEFCIEHAHVTQVTGLEGPELAA
jgi:hypothetical protein